jgi:tRNA1Val (adenine37-N6)-methyltransferase
MKVGTDGMLLGAWAPIDGAQRVLDIGTGTGLLALMLAQRAPEAQIDAVEIDALAAAQATDNVQASPFAARISIHAQAIQTWHHAVGYDLIVSNPPYFAAGIPPDDPARLQARHQQSLDLPTLLKRSSEWLAPLGQAAFVFPYDQAARWQAEAARWGLLPQRMLRVRPTPTKPFRRLLISFSRAGGPVEEADLVIQREDSLEYSAGYRALTQAFYLIF